jgi:hypothetical protein
VALADQDDRWRPDKLAVLRERFASSPAVDAFFSNASLIDGDGRSMSGTLWRRVGFTAPRQGRWGDGRALEVLLKGDVVTGATLAIRRRALDTLLPLPPEGWHDRSIALLLAVKGTIAPIGDTLLSYRLHARNQAGVPRLHLRPALNDAMAADLETLRSQLMAVVRHPAIGAADPRSVLQICEKARHLERRLALPQDRRRRVEAVAAEVARGGYRRYGAAIRGPLRDLL